MLDLNTMKRWIGTHKPTAATRDDDSLDAFGSESSPSPKASRRTWRVAGWPRPGRRGILIAAATIITVTLTGYALRSWKAVNVEAASASLTIESLPAGADVLAAGELKGKTPLTLAVTPGEHSFELVHDGRRKPLRAVARAGAAVVHHVEFDVTPPPPSRSASLRITTDPSNLRVLVNGVTKGKSPLTLEDIAPGKHRVQVIGTSGTLERHVEVAEGESAAVIISAPPRPAAAAAGWLTVSSPVPLQITEGKEIIGTSASSKIMLPTGRHALVLANAEIGFTEKRTVQVPAGANATLKVQLPNARLSINAVPWAEVWVDGVRIGETPIGNHVVRLGPHEVVLRHPEFGERRQTVIVGLNKPARISVDMRKSGS